MIKAQNLVKRFGSKVAVDDVSFSVEKGEVLGFLGPNGAGKSTTMRIITSFLNADSGTVTIGGHNLEDDPIKAKSIVGYLPENAPSYGDMTVDGFLKFTAKLRGMNRKATAAAVDQAVKTCFLEPVRYQTIETLSKGYTHRTCFAQSILHDPDVLILDEPTDGLDPNQKHEVRSLIKRMSERKAIILSTHILEEVDAVCNRVIVINNGRIVANSVPDKLRREAEHAGDVVLTVHDRPFKEVAERLKQVDGVGEVTNMADDDGAITVLCRPKGDKGGPNLAREIAQCCTKRGWDISELRTERGRLDDVFRTITTSDGGAS